MEFKKYNHLIEEKKISDFWIKKGSFKPKKNKSKKAFSIVIPPPNITGRLHMGHALNNSLQDVLVRFNRMKGNLKVKIFINNLLAERLLLKFLEPFLQNILLWPTAPKNCIFFIAMSLATFDGPGRPVKPPNFFC